MRKDNVFHSPTKGKMELASVVSEISNFMAQNSGQKYEVVVGTDSTGTQKADADFVTAIIVHRVGHGGRYFWRRTNGGKIFHTLRDRIHNEVLLSLQTAEDLMNSLKDVIISEPKYDLHIHIDVGVNGPTKDMIKEVVGMVRGNGFKAKIKPDSYAASYVADRYV